MSIHPAIAFFLPFIFSQLLAEAWGQEQWMPAKAEGCLRVATYNVSLYRKEAGKLGDDLAGGDRQAGAVAAVIRMAQPDILLLNELDYSETSDHASLFAEKYLGDSNPDLLGSGSWQMPYVYSAPVNTGVPSGMDLNKNGRKLDPEDAWGYGQFPGQYGMAVLSRFELDRDNIRTMREFLWSDLPGALRPQAGDEEPYYPDKVWSRLRLSSKSFWDVPVKSPLGTIHVLASHPTPPGFDGPEDRNGCRNHDEIRLVQGYIEGADFIRDDLGRRGGLADQEAFVVLGDLNSDPVDGGSRRQAILDLIQHPRIASFAAPTSRGAVVAADNQGLANREHRGDPAEDTADFSDRSVGNLRVDYVLPSAGFQIVAAGVFWPELNQVPEPQREAMKSCLSASDHHLVWVDLKPNSTR